MSSKFVEFVGALTKSPCFISPEAIASVGTLPGCPSTRITFTSGSHALVTDSPAEVVAKLQGEPQEEESVAEQFIRELDRDVAESEAVQLLERWAGWADKPVFGKPYADMVYATKALLAKLKGGK